MKSRPTKLCTYIVCMLLERSDEKLNNNTVHVVASAYTEEAETGHMEH